MALMVNPLRLLFAQDQSKPTSRKNFLIQGTLKPSIETCLHAILPHRVVIHVHCVNTIAGAIRQDAPDYFAKRLHGFPWAYVPYTKPGANLAAKGLEASGKPEDVLYIGQSRTFVWRTRRASSTRLLK